MVSCFMPGKKLLLHSIPKEEVTRLYWEEMKSRKEIAFLFDCSECAVRNFMNRNDIPARGLSAANTLVANATSEARSEKLKGRPSGAKGKTWKISAEARERRRVASLGDSNPNWKGGVSSDPEHRRQQRRNHKALRRGGSPQMPPWADKENISEIYKSAKARGMTVDHIVPLKNKQVCGLHCESNLRIVSASVNRKKGNQFCRSCAALGSGVCQKCEPT